MKKDLVKAICVLKCAYCDEHGTVKMSEISRGGPTKFEVDIFALPVGYHGLHIHRSGNILQGAKSLCDHYNPENNVHGDLNEEQSHVGDLGNIKAIFDERTGMGKVKTSFIAEKVRLRGPFSVLGRGLIVHSDKDDLGRGGYPDSLTTGHSGERILWGIIAIHEEC